MEKEGHSFSPPPAIKEQESVSHPENCMPSSALFTCITCVVFPLTSLQEVMEDLNGDPEENSSHYMAILIEALSILGKVEETLDVCHMDFFIVYRKCTNSLSFPTGHW